MATRYPARMLIVPLMSLFLLVPPAQPAGTSAALSSPRDSIQFGTRSKNIFLIMIDGLRWQEVFAGADTRLIHKDFGVTSEKRVHDAYWRETPHDRRATLLPFIWSAQIQPVAPTTQPANTGSQLFGNLHKGSSATITNAFKVSYPGYAEVLCGFANDASIKDNRRIWNPHPTVFEWLHNKPAYAGRVAAFGAWDVFPWIFNTERCGFPVDDGLKPIDFGKTSDTIAAASTLRKEIPRVFSASTYDALLFRPAFEWIKLNKPRAVFICFGETDEWAHQNKYEHYLDAAHRSDGYIKELWDWCQSTDGYKDCTTFIITCDHGRGGDDAPGYTDGQLKQWSDHNPKVIGAEQTWIMILGPDTPHRGEVSDAPRVTQAQIAATLAAALGENYPEAQPRASAPIQGAITGKVQ